MPTRRGASLLGIVVAALLALSSAPAAASEADSRSDGAVAEPVVVDALPQAQSPTQAQPVSEVNETRVSDVSDVAVVESSPWSARSACRAPNGDGVVVVTNTGTTAAAIRLVRLGDGHTVNATGAPGPNRVAVAWSSPSDRWQVRVDGTAVAEVVIGNNWCITTEVRAERLRFACDGADPVVDGYEIVDNFEGVELRPSVASGGQNALPATVRFELSAGTYATSTAPEVFTVTDGGTFHFGAVVRYDAEPLDCSDPSAPQVDGGPDVFATEHPWQVELVDGVIVPTISTDDPGEPSGDATQVGESNKVVASDTSSRSQSVTTAAVTESGDVLPVTGAGGRTLAALGGLLVAIGLVVVWSTRRWAGSVRNTL